MPDKRAHRGAHPEDGKLFAADQWPRLRTAVAEYSWLLSQGYADKSALTLVGDHHQLHARQRMAVMRCACSDASLEQRRVRLAPAEALRGEALLIDGYNVLTSVEAALAGGTLLLGRDGCIRDIASIHGSFRKVQETPPAVTLIARAVRDLGAEPVTWLLDQPVSNSGRLKTLIEHAGTEMSVAWDVQIVPSPDHVMIASDQIIATADSVVLDRCRRWFNLARWIIERDVPDAWLIDLSSPVSTAA